MNDEQLKIIKRYIKWEKSQAEHMEGEDEETRQSVKEWFHSDALKEFQKAAKPKNPNPPEKLSTKPCSPDCFLCHPDLLRKIEKKFKKN